jgi:hypothetical protein
LNGSTSNTPQELITTERTVSSSTEEDLKNTSSSNETISKATAISFANLEQLKTSTNKTIITKPNRHHITETDISHLITQGDFIVKKDKDKIVFNTKRFSSYSMLDLYNRRFYYGFNLGLKKQGMLTTLKEDSPLTDFRQNTILDYGFNFGATIGLPLSDKINIETTIHLNSTAGYKRVFDTEGFSYQENLDLSYSSINLLAKKMNTKSTVYNKVYSTNFIGGIYVSYLKSAFSNATGTSIEIDNYKKIDYGIVFGIEQDRYLTKTLIITPGVRYNLGIPNISNSSSPFKTVRNYSFELNLGVKYIFLKSKTKKPTN